MDRLYQLLPIILFPIAILLFWKKRRIGWILISGMNILLFIQLLGLFLWHIKKIPWFETALVSCQGSLSSYFPNIIIHLVVILMLMHKTIRVNYHVSGRMIFLSILVAAIFTPFTEFYAFISHLL
jgi:hypothetical protein